jgi:hypothetical protein
MDKQTEKLLIGGGIVALLYFGIINPILKKVGIKKTQEEKDTEIKNAAIINKQVEVSKKAVKQTKTDAEWKVIADQIYNDLRYSAISDNKGDAGYQVARVKNDTDFWILFKYFAKRREYLFGIPSGSLMNLQQFINSNLAKSEINKINDNYKRKGIKFSF